MNLLVIFGFIGISQGLYFAITSWTLHFPKKTKVLLNLLMVSHLILLSSTIFQEMGWYVKFPHFLYVRVPIPLIIGPSLFLLHREVFLEENSGGKLVYHYLPFLICVLLLMPYYIQGSALKLPEQSPDHYLVINYAILEHGKVVHLFGYLVWVLVVLYHQKETSKYLSFLHSYRKLFFFLVASYLTIVILGLIHAISSFYGMNWLHNTEIIIALTTTLIASSMVYTFIKYDERWKSAYKKAQAKTNIPGQLILRLKEMMEEEKLYRKANLKVSEVAHLLGVPRQSLSEILSAELQCNFSEFVNSYRLKEVKCRITDPSENHKTMLGIAYESGFNSKSSFQRIFKDATGMTPRDYRNSKVKEVPK